MFWIFSLRPIFKCVMSKEDVLSKLEMEVDLNQKKLLDAFLKSNNYKYAIKDNNKKNTSLVTIEDITALTAFQLGAKYQRYLSEDFIAY